MPRGASRRRRRVGWSRVEHRYGYTAQRHRYVAYSIYAARYCCYDASEGVGCYQGVEQSQAEPSGRPMASGATVPVYLPSPYLIDPTWAVLREREGRGGGTREHLSCPHTPHTRSLARANSAHRPRSHTLPPCKRPDLHSCL